MAFEDLLDNTAAVYRRGYGDVLDVRGRSTSGYEIDTYKLIPNYDSVPVRLDHRLPRVEYRPEGRVEIQQAVAYLPIETSDLGMLDIKKDDQLLINAIHWRITALKPVDDFSGPHHYEAILVEDPLPVELG